MEIPSFGEGFLGHDGLPAVHCHPAHGRNGYRERSGPECFSCCHIHRRLDRCVLVRDSRTNRGGMTIIERGGRFFRHEEISEIEALRRKSRRWSKRPTPSRGESKS